MKAALLCVGLIGCGGDTALKEWGRTPATVEILLDRSDGMQDDTGRACTRLTEIAAAVLDSPARTRADDLTVYMTGTADDVQATRLWSTSLTDLKCVADPMHGRTCPDPAVDTARAAAVEALDAACRTEAGPTAWSPLFRAVSERLGDLRQRCATRTCRLVVYSDLLEIQEGGICTAIHGAESYNKRGACPPTGKGTTPPPLPEPVDASGIDVVVCGLADSAEGRRDRLTSDVAARIPTVWSGLITNPASFAVFNDCHGVSL